MAYKQAQNRKKRLLKTYRQTKTNYGCGVFFDEDKGRYIRYSPSNTPGYTKFLKKVSNRKIRRARTDIGNHGAYKRQYDYWWTLF
jgi:hypothetical protein